MSTLFNDMNERFKTLITGLHSPQSVAKAFKQYLADKTVIASQQITMIAEALTIDPDQDDGISLSTKINDIITTNGATTNSVMLGPDGRFYPLTKLLTAVVHFNGEEEVSVDEAYGEMSLSVTALIDSAVDSFQSAKIYESAFSVLSVTEDAAYASISDIDTRIRAMGLDLTTRASQTLVDIGDVLSDVSSGVIQKISALTKLITIGAEDIASSSTVILLPDIDQTNYQGASPFSAMLQNIDIDLTKPLGVVVGTVVAAANVTTKLLNSVGQAVQKGWNWLSRKIDDIVFNPIDFYVANKKATSNMVDMPFFDETIPIVSLDDAGHPGYNKVAAGVRAMPIGSLRVNYSPFSVTTVYRTSASHVRVISHLIPSKPIEKHLASDPDFGNAIMAGYTLDFLRIVNDFSDGINNTPTSLFDRYISNQPYAEFEPSSDDDAYFLAASAASILRFNILVDLFSSMFGVKRFTNVYPDMMNKTLSQLFSDSRIYSSWDDSLQFVIATGASTRNESNPSVITYRSLFNLQSVSDRQFFISCLEGTLTSNDVSNTTFSRLFNLPKTNVAAGRILLLCFANYFDVMEFSQDEFGEIPSFIPSIMESEYPTPKYAIATDSKNGNKLEKLFTGILITVVAISVAVFVAVKVVGIKGAMMASQLRVNGLQRVVENMDPNDPDYMSTFKMFKKARRTHNVKNSLLSLVGLGASKTASGAMASSYLSTSGLQGADKFFDTDLTPITTLIK